MSIPGGLLRPQMRNGITHLGAGRYGLGGALVQNTDISGNFNLTLSGTGRFGLGTSNPATRFNNAASLINQTDGTTALGTLGFGYEVAQANYAGAIVNTLNATSANGLVVRIARANSDARALWVGANSPALVALGNGWVGVNTVPQSRFDVQTAVGTFSVDDTGYVTIPPADFSGFGRIKTAPAIGIQLMVGTSTRLYIPAANTSNAAIFHSFFQIGMDPSAGGISGLSSYGESDLILRGGDGAAGRAANIIFKTRNNISRGIFTADGIFAVGTTTPNPAAIAEFSSVTGGVLIPRMTTAQRDAISSPVNALIVYNTDTNTFQGRAAGAWQDFH